VNAANLGRWTAADDAVTGSLAYRVVDVFADQPFAGNPLAVVLDGSGLTAEGMQAIAAEFNLSETTFVLPPSTSEANYRVRIFTPALELPFAGHPSLGTAWVMRATGVVGDGLVVQECHAGLVGLRIEGDTVTLTGAEPSIEDPLEAEPVLAAIGLTSSDLIGDPVRRAGTGLPWTFVHVRADAVGRAEPDPRALRRLGPTGNVAVFSYADGAAHARAFAGDAGVTEDPATGSAALGLGVWLAACGYADPDGETAYVIHQGAEIGRPSRLFGTVRCVSADVVECRVSGTVRPVAEGTMRRP
jgi:trans-2,3-dihydro-3-hydroxyanthranilate isomerase